VNRKKRLVVLVVILCVIAGLVGFVLGADEEIQQGGQSSLSMPVTIELNERVLAYEDPMRNIERVDITQRRVLQDALWWCVNDPDSTDAERAQCFAMISQIHEAREVQFSKEDEALLMKKLPEVWGPAVLEKVTTRRRAGREVNR
jgi:hypothetical protein